MADVDDVDDWSVRIGTLAMQDIHRQWHLAMPSWPIGTVACKNPLVDPSTSLYWSRDLSMVTCRECIAMLAHLRLNL